MGPLSDTYLSIVTDEDNPAETAINLYRPVFCSALTVAPSATAAELAGSAGSRPPCRRSTQTPTRREGVLHLGNVGGESGPRPLAFPWVKGWRAGNSCVPGSAASGTMPAG